MTKIHFRPYNPNQTVLFPPRIDEDIAEHDPVLMVDALVESLNESDLSFCRRGGPDLSGSVDTALGIRYAENSSGGFHLPFFLQ